MVDTGVRLTGVPLEPNPTSASVGINWPPQSVSAIPPQFETFLHRLGLPRGFRVDQVRPSLPAGKQQILLEFDVEHADVRMFQDSHQLVLDHQGAARGIDELRSKLRSELRGRLAKQVAGLDSFRGLRASVRQEDSDGFRFVVDLEYPGIGPLTMGLAVSEQGRVVLSGQPSVEQRQRLAAKICELIPPLNDLLQLTLIDAVELEEGGVNLHGSLRLRATVINSAEDIGPVKWSYDVSQGRERVEFDTQHFRDLRGLRKRLAQLPQAQPEDPQALAPK